MTRRDGGSALRHSQADLDGVYKSNLSLLPYYCNSSLFSGYCLPLSASVVAVKLQFLLFFRRRRGGGVAFQKDSEHIRHSHPGRGHH